MADDEIITKVMAAVESFYFDDGEDCGEKIFNEFAEQHHELFEDNCDAEEMENKLE